MLIDWFTVAAQALNFLILVWLMKRLLYKPILQAIDTREKRIAAETADAAAKLAEAQKQGALYQSKNDAFDKQRAALLQKAVDDAAAEHMRLLDEARKAADALGAKRQKADLDAANLLTRSIARRTGDEVFAIARKALTDLASASLEQRMIDLFLERLRALSGKAKDGLAEAVKSAGAVLRTSFDLPPAQRLVIEKALDEIFASTIRVTYEASPDLICGIDLSADGRKIGWSIADYLTALENSAAPLVPDSDNAAAKPAVLAK